MKKKGKILIIMLAMMLLLTGITISVLGHDNNPPLIPDDDNDNIGIDDLYNDANFHTAQDPDLKFHTAQDPGPNNGPSGF